MRRITPAQLRRAFAKLEGTPQPLRPLPSPDQFRRFNGERAVLVQGHPLSGDRRIPLAFSGVGGDIPENA